MLVDWDFIRMVFVAMLVMCVISWLVMMVCAVILLPFVLWWDRRKALSRQRESLERQP
jgi:Flp pilus assembly protein TadB